MKNAVILHGTGNNSQGNWFPWLKGELKKKDYKVWVPDLPESDRPNGKLNAEYILKNWELNEDSLIVGHSSGAVTIFSILQALPENKRVAKCIFISAFKNNLGEENLSDLFTEPFDFSKIKHKAKKFIFVHSDNDPYIPVEQAVELAKEVDGELIIKPGQGHFNLSSNRPCKEFPFLLTLID